MVPEQSVTTSSGFPTMKWFIAAILFLLASLAFGLSLPAYAMYALLGIMLTAAGWRGIGSESLSAERDCNRYSANVGDMVAVVITLKNASRLPVAWTLIEDLLPRRAITYQPPSLQVVGSRIQLALVPRRRPAHDARTNCGAIAADIIRLGR